MADTPSYVPGQRWLSDADPDLGVGTLVELAPRRLKIAFPAVNEVRIYAVPDAPLSRLVLEPGDSFADVEGHHWRVTERLERGGLFVYRCEGRDGEPCLVEESRIDPRLQLNRPREKFLAGRLDDDRWFELRLRGWRAQAETLASPVHGLVGPRIQLIPHQLYIAAQVAGRHQPRALLADEVGLGKTIEAGLILHKLLLDRRIERLLVIVPEHLLHQWLVEMLRRFNLRLSLFDRERFDQAEAANPFLGEQRVLVSLEFLVSEPRVARAVLEGEWDMVVVDEAHHLHWTPEESSLEYDLVEALADQAPGCLLLSATPEQLGRAGHFARLRLLDPGRYPDYESFLAEETRYRQVAALAGRLLDGIPLDDGDQVLLETLLGDTDTSDPEALARRLMDLHGTGRVLFRNTRQAIEGFPQRHIHPAALTWPEPYAAIADPIDAVTPERQVPGWTEFDPRLSCLLALLDELGSEKVLLIATHAETVLELQRWLRERHAIHAAVFHEGMEIVERDRAAAYFADPEGARLLLCSEIGSEGRNFQFVQHLVLFDLPLEPDLLEQRIGRLDRIGQGPEIHIHVPCFDRGPMWVLYRWYHEGVDALARPSPVAVALHERFEGRLARALADPGRLDALLEEVVAERRRLEGELAAGRDRLLELQSCDPEQAEALVAAVADADHSQTLQAYLSDYWDAFGVEHEPGPGRSLVVRPGDHMLHERFPELPAEGATVTFERDDALAHEDRLFLTWEHPMVRGALDLLSDSALGSAAFTVLDSGPLPSGTLLLELVFVLACNAPAELQAHRWLPPTPLRLVLDRAGNDHAERLPPERLRGTSMHRDRKTAAAVIKSQAGLVRTLIQRGERLAAERAEPLRQAALADMRRELSAELERLAELGDDQEEEARLGLSTRLVVLEDYLQQAGLRLDALRLIVRT